MLSARLRWAIARPPAAHCCAFSGFHPAIHRPRVGGTRRRRLVVGDGRREQVFGGAAFGGDLHSHRGLLVPGRAMGLAADCLEARKGVFLSERARRHGFAAFSAQPGEHVREIDPGRRYYSTTGRHCENVALVENAMIARLRNAFLTCRNHNLALRWI